MVSHKIAYKVISNKEVEKNFDTKINLSCNIYTASYFYFLLHCTIHDWTISVNLLHFNVLYFWGKWLIESSCFQILKKIINNNNNKTKANIKTPLFHTCISCFQMECRSLAPFQLCHTKLKLLDSCWNVIHALLHRLSLLLQIKGHLINIHLQFVDMLFYKLQ